MIGTHTRSIMHNITAQAVISLFSTTCKNISYLALYDMTSFDFAAIPNQIFLPHQHLELSRLPCILTSNHYKNRQTMLESLEASLINKLQDDIRFCSDKRISSYLVCNSEDHGLSAV